MARWTASAKWAAGPALDGQRDMPLALRLSEGLGSTGGMAMAWLFLLASDSAPRSARVQEQSRYSAPAAPASDFAWRFAPCISGGLARRLARGTCARSHRESRNDGLLERAHSSSGSSDLSTSTLTERG